MRLVGIKVENIRSYHEAEISFSRGITLLSGDTGSGKSTILLSIEFALFGLSRGELTGPALLRHGADSGSVVLHFVVEGVQYSICRTLKRTKDTIQQDVGWLEENGSRSTLTASELRAKVFEIMGYPLQFLTKQKNLLYRFTVYTPQEEMKAILTQPVDERIETIRRIFGVDMYKTVRENAQYTARSLKSKEQAHQEVVVILSKKLDELGEKISDTESLENRLKELKERKITSEKQVVEAEKNLIVSEKRLAELQQELQISAIRKRDSKMLSEEISRLNQMREQREKRVNASKETIDSLIKKKAELEQLISIPAEDITERLQEYRKTIEMSQTERGKLLSIKEQCGHKPAVGAGATCPTCFQQVTGEHLDKISVENDAKYKAAERKLAKLDSTIAISKETAEKLSGAMEHVQQLKSINDRLEFQTKTLEGHLSDFKEILDVIKEKEAVLEKMPPEKDDSKVQEEYELVQHRIREQKTVISDRQRETVSIEKELSVLEEKIKQMESLKEEHEKTILELKSRKDQQATASNMRDWLLDRFTPLATTIEQHVLRSIHGSFDAAFRDWFSKLIEDDSLMARLDSNFTPVLEQNGFDTDVSYLSGGERTSVSLAYRLALVHTIHTLLPHLGTTGIVMLDEPTDGFSSEQLSRMRDVLQELAMEQVILVSHEQQLEGFVDRIIRIVKTNSGSVIEV